MTTGSARSSSAASATAGFASWLRATQKVRLPRLPYEPEAMLKVHPSSMAHYPASSRPSRPSATIAICAYTKRRAEILCRAISEVSAQLAPGDELVIVVDHAPDLLTFARHTFEAARVLPNAHARGLSGARNTAVEAARGGVIVFLDDDAVPEPGWLDTLLAVYSDDSVIGVGGYVVPVWPVSVPWWLPPEFLWVVGCSYSGLPKGLEEIRNPIGANMSFRRDVFTKAGLFLESLGRVGTLPAGCEETELSIRATKAIPLGRIVHQTASVVQHQVSLDRTTLSYFRRRCWSEGVSKAIVTRVGDQAGALSTERRYVFSTLATAVFRELRTAVRGDMRGIGRAIVLIAGAIVTTCGYVSRHRRGVVTS